MRVLIKRHIRGREVLAFFVLANLLYLLMIFVTIPQVTAYSGGMKLFDMMPLGYDLVYARNLLDTLGTNGRAVYLTLQLPVDMFYPLFSGIAYCLLMAWLFKKLNLIDKPAAYLCVIPLVAGMFDYLENFGIIAMITSYPAVSALQVSVVSIFSVIKSMLSAAFFTLLIVSLLVFLVKQTLTALKREHKP
ncbi:MAG: hypothetical protein NT040_01700 [Bacteroidetes bacterium]|nr:hypothetical protein [Bacteroidota bacterium]